MENILKISDCEKYFSSLSDDDKMVIKNKVESNDEFRKRMIQAITLYMCCISRSHAHELYTSNLNTYLKKLKDDCDVTLSDIFCGLGANEMYWFSEHAPISILTQMFEDKCFTSFCSTHEILVLQKKRPELIDVYKKYL